MPYRRRPSLKWSTTLPATRSRSSDGLIDAANAAGGKDNVTVVYAEGPRFAEGEDTRDLRAYKARFAASGAQEMPQRSEEDTGRQGGVQGGRRGRWRVATLVILLSVVLGLAVYTQRDRLPLPDLAHLWPLSNAARGPGTLATLRVGPPDSISAAVAAAPAGAEVVVEPGEYREQLHLKTGVRVTSRVPRGATLRLPGGASRPTRQSWRSTSATQRFPGFESRVTRPLLSARGSSSEIHGLAERHRGQRRGQGRD